MKLFKGVIARHLIVSLIMLAALVVVTAATSVGVVRYIDATFSGALARTNLAALGLQLQVESTAIVNLAQRYVASSADADARLALRGEIAARRTRIDSIVERAVDLTSAGDLTERTQLAHIQQRAVNLNLQVNRLIQAFDAESAYGAATARELEILLADYEMPLAQAMDSFQAYESGRVRQAQAEAGQVVGAALVGMALAAVLAGGLGLGTAWRSFKRIIVPLADLHAGVEQLRLGRLDRPVQVGGRDEMSALANAFNTMADQLQQRIRAELAARQELENLNIGLERRVAERTAELARRVRQLDLITRVGRDITSLLEPQALLSRTAKLILDTFGYYAVVIMLVDKPANQVSLKAAATLEGNLLERGLTLAIGQGLVGHVAATGEPLVVGDVAAEPRYHPDARLPHVRSELVLPLRIGDEVLGVLDLESDALNAFGSEDVHVLQTLADQIAIALHNARLYQAEAQAHQTADALREEAQAARADAEEATRLKSQFLANMSHELRTPLNSIINFAYLLSLGTEGPLTPDQADLIHRIGDSGRHLLELINDILDLAKVETGRLELFFEDVDVVELIEGVISTIASLLRDKPIELRLDLPGELPLVRADRTRVRQVLLNLLSNAVKFTERGCIVVRAQASEKWVTLSVQDTGLGMAAEDIPRAFAEFVRLDGALARRANGTGLGLSISKRLVEMHGGRIWVDSQPGVGSTFYFTLPRALAAQLEPAGEPLEARVLVIDDDPAIRDAVARQLSHGYQVLKLTDSRQTLEVAREQLPDVIVLDVLMPYRDGWDVLAALKSDPQTQNIPVVVCSMLREHNLALALGAAGYLVKPVEREGLRRTLERLVPPGGKVLAVDDDPDALEIIGRMLDGMTYRVSTAGDGRTGLAAAREQLPDVVVLDLVMPGLSGFDVLAELRADPRTADLPVVVVTAKDLTAQERARLQDSVVALLLKGQFTPDEFVNTIRRAVRRSRQEGGHGQA